MVCYVGDYVCGFCGFEFKKNFSVYSPKSKKQKGTSQVKCPHCKNFLKVFDDAKKIEEIKDKV